MSKLNVKNQQGMSLVEILLVIVAMAFAALLIANLPLSISSIAKNKHQSQAREIAEREIEKLRQDIFSEDLPDNLPGESTPFTDTALAGLPGASAAYRIEPCPVEVCAISDDNKKPKKVNVTVSWQEAGETKTVELVTIIDKKGLNQ